MTKDVTTTERDPTATRSLLRPAEPEARETSGATTGLVLEFVRQQAGEAAVEETLRRAGVPFTAAELTQPAHWVSYDTRIRLFAAATEALDDPATMFRVGREALAHGMNPGLVLLVRAIGSPRQVYRQLPKAVAKFSTTSTMQIVESGATHATIRFELHEGYAHSRLDCDYVQGLIGMVPTVAVYTATDPGLTGVLGAGFFRNLGGKAELPAALEVIDDSVRQRLFGSDDGQVDPIALHYFY